MQSETLQLGLLIILAVALGALLPVLFLLAGALRELRALVKRSGPKVDQVLERAREVTERLEKTTRGLDEKEKAVDEILDAGRELARSVEGVKRSMRIAQAVGSSVGPAVATFLTAMRDNGNGRRDLPDRPEPERTGDRQPATPLTGGVP